MELKRLETDETLRELKTHGDSRFPFQYYLDDFSLYENHWEDWHWHNEVEFASVSSGCADCLNSRALRPSGPEKGFSSTAESYTVLNPTKTGKCRTFYSRRISSPPEAVSSMKNMWNP